GRQWQPQLLERRPHALARLLNGGPREPHDGEARQAAAHERFDAHQDGLDADHGGRRHDGVHAVTIAAPAPGLASDSAAAARLPAFAAPASHQPAGNRRTAVLTVGTFTAGGRHSAYVGWDE